MPGMSRLCAFSLLAHLGSKRHIFFSFLTLKCTWDWGNVGKKVHGHQTVGLSLILMWVRSRNCGCLVTWFCYQLIAKPGNKTAAVPWPDPCIILWLQFQDDTASTKLCCCQWNLWVESLWQTSLRSWHLHQPSYGSGHETAAVLLPGFAINW